MQILKTQDLDFNHQIQKIINRTNTLPDHIETTVKEIIADVQTKGDAALVKFTREFDGHEDLTVTDHEINTAKNKVPPEVYSALKTARDRIMVFHEKQTVQTWQYEQNGEILGQMITPLESTGIYVPGGKAIYPSSVLMNAIPAVVAGVKKLIMVTPDNGKGIPPVILAAADLCGISEIYKIGGAQAIAALAYGTRTVPAVDKIVGPGNIYVALAKKLVFGKVDIDMIAGPSEILIISDGSGSPDCVAADMLSQAEHDEMASAVLITTDDDFAAKVKDEVSLQLTSLPKKKIASESIEKYGAIIVTDSLPAAAEISNRFAPEHLELYVKHPQELLQWIRNAGAIFMGHYTPEALGDYIAGPNHVLPTGGTARFFSPLSVDDFIKRTSLVSFSRQAFKACADPVMTLARTENLEAHARSVEKRLK